MSDGTYIGSVAFHLELKACDDHDDEIVVA